jgi:hypothetical protein
MKKFILFSIGLILVLAGGCSKQQVDEYAVVSFLVGDVKKNNGSVSIGDIIKEKDELTTGNESFCDIKIGGSIIRIKEKSKLLISSLIRKNDSENTQLGMDTGKMLCKPKKLLKDDSFTVKTPTAVAGVRGTQFTIEIDSMKTTRVKVFDGKLQVAKRIKQFEGNFDKILAISPVIEKEEKLVITEKEVINSEKVVELILKKETAKGEGGDVMSRVIQASNKEIVSSKKDIEKFAAGDFVKENKEIIDVKEKPAEVIKQIVKVIEKEKEEPKPDGRLLITKYEVYFIKNGKVLWEGKVMDEPLKAGDKLYIASGEYVYCASVNGPVFWRKNIINDGKLELKEGKLTVFTKGEKKELNSETGEQM